MASRVFRPISVDQVEAALTLRGQWLPGWASAADVLYGMHDGLAGEDVYSVLGRVAAVNSLYNAGLSSVMGMVRHILDLSADGGLERPGDDPADVVARIAFLPGRQSDAPGCQVFASKYTHFFLSPHRYPIYDQHAARALMRHYGLAPKGILAGPDRYRNFCYLLDSVVADSPDLGRVGLGDLDAFLWLAGVYRAWKRKRLGLAKEGINRDTARFFELHDEADDPAGKLLKRLVIDDWFFESVPECQSLGLPNLGFEQNAAR